MIFQAGTFEPLDFETVFVHLLGYRVAEYFNTAVGLPVLEEGRGERVTGLGEVAPGGGAGE